MTEGGTPARAGRHEPLTLLKRLEIAGKVTLAFLAALLLWRPGRKARAQKLAV